MKKFLIVILLLMVATGICLYGCDEGANETEHLAQNNDTQDENLIPISDGETNGDAVTPTTLNETDKTSDIIETPIIIDINVTEKTYETPNENSNEPQNELPIEPPIEPESPIEHDTNVAEKADETPSENSNELQNELPIEPETPPVQELTPNEENLENSNTEEIRDDDVKPEEHTHKFVSEITKQATCTEKGLITYTCTCGDTYTEDLPVLQHDLVKHKGRASTCTKAGYGDYETCNNCDYSTKTELPLIAHNYVNGKCTMCGIYDLIYEQNSLGYKVGKYEGLATFLEISDEVNGKPVTEISEKAFEKCRDITEIVIGKNVTAIGKSAFANCVKLTEMSIPEGVIKIEQNTFSMCVCLKEITLPKSLAYIDCDAFWRCTQLKTIRYNGSVEDWDGIAINDDNLSGITVICTDDTIEYKIN